MVSASIMIHMQSQPPLAVIAPAVAYGLSPAAGLLTGCPAIAAALKQHSPSAPVRLNLHGAAVRRRSVRAQAVVIPFPNPRD